MSLKLAIAGGGAMGGALASGLVRAGTLKASEIIIIEPLATRRDELRHDLKVQVSGRPADSFRAEVLLLAVKPQTLPEAGPAYAKGFARKTVISILAGSTIATLRTWFSGGIARVMPNTPALVGEGASGICFSEVAVPERERIRKWLAAVGEVVEVAKESDLDAVTGLSGSGPAYVFEMIEALSDGGVLAGLPRDVALKLAAQTVLGAARMVIATGRHPAQLKDQVTSPGGTTIAGCAELERHGMRSAFIAAVKAATERSRQLGSAATAGTMQRKKVNKASSAPKRRTARKGGGR
ncbi:MAG: pyrroline-5-carboxylate reductase [Deltaproteobacteria bacterium]|nr:pyrroline-5-carboxylate reductase [Deltaproteobacteria bacterium]